ncbi:hypothetical protein RBG61_02090 [Paludicola sp. MB14-C6]|uniref:hypothetical protein n=1 Tax=Paludihabitans sp. MB14-C6 TaxID=3070656 RepID=UPI0027DDCFC2|nr:hypothetical protein [Paludicola sp. MB14-C6]WMJ23482.1 hypothetical protein RBG61_02090 [Paludicola sp. MB14-C6]
MFITGFTDDLRNELANELVDCECPYCNQAITVSLNEDGDTITCPHCNNQIPVTVSGIDEIGNDIDNAINSIFE